MENLRLAQWAEVVLGQRRAKYGPRAARCPGFDVTEVIARFLPYSFRGRLPASPRLTRTYLRCPMLWRVLGEQFLILGGKPG